MKTPFLEMVPRGQAASAEAAFARIGPRHGKTHFNEVRETAETVRAAIEAKAYRVEQNPWLYGDKIAEYRAMLDKLNSSPGGPLDVAQAMLDHGDSRVDNPRNCCVMGSPDEGWLVFGFEF